MKFRALRCTLFALFVPLASSANAQMAQNLLIGNAKALALGNAVTADPPEIDSIHFNPAGLTRLKGTKSQLKFVAASVDIVGQLISTPEYDQYQADIGYSDPLANTTTEIDKFAVYLPGEGITPIPFAAAPLGGFSFSPEGARWTAGTAFYAPLMLGFTRKDEDPGINFGRELAISRLTMLSPTLAYEFNHGLSIGAGINFSYVGAGLNVPFRTPGELLVTLGQFTDQICGRRDDLGNQFVLDIEVIDLCEGSVNPYEDVLTLIVDVEKNISISYNLGVLWEATPWLTLGFTYQAPTTDRLTGDVTIELGQGIYDLVEGAAAVDQVVRDILVTLGWPDEGRSITSTGYFDLPLPAHASFGISTQLSPKWKVNLDVKWTETSKWDSFKFIVNESIGFLTLLQFIDGVEEDGIDIPRGYEDTVNWGIGFEYQYKSDLALRFGYEPRKTGIPDDKRDHVIPIGDFDLFGFGFSKMIDKDTVFDFTIGYGKSDQYIAAGTSTNGNDNTRFDNIIYNPVAGLDVRSTTELVVVEMSYLSNF